MLSQYVTGKFPTLEHEPTQREKREGLENTLLGRAQADGDLAAGGRFKKEIETRVTGVPTYPPQPPSSFWASDPVPPEEPLGVDVNEMTAEVQASPAAIPTTVATPTTVEVDCAGEGEPVIGSTIATLSATDELVTGSSAPKGRV
jgi:hypothetical protein